MLNDFFDVGQSLLGKKVSEVKDYDVGILFPIPRLRQHLYVLDKSIRFYGFDVWNAYEVYFLDQNSRPVVQIAEIIYDADSEFIIESKSLKMYLYSLHNCKFDSVADLESTIAKDLSAVLCCSVQCKLYNVDSTHYRVQESHSFNLLDGLAYKSIQEDSILQYQNSLVVHEKLYTNLLKSNCPVTNQPDFASLYIEYKGKKIDHGSILQYVVSLKNINEFHEQCVERIFIKLYSDCELDELMIFARYTRRGGIDINPIRSSKASVRPYNDRNIRQ